MKKRIELLNHTLKLIEAVTTDEALQSKKHWLTAGVALSVSSVESFYVFLEEIFLSEKRITERFSRKLVFRFLENKIIAQKKSHIDFSQKDSDDLYSELLSIQPKNLYVVAPISGIRISKSGNQKFSSFEFGRLSHLKAKLANDAEYYIKIYVENIYDEQIAIEKAKNAFDDFTKLVVFVSGRNDKQIVIKTGLPAYPKIGEGLMYVESTSYQLFCGSESFPGGAIHNKYVETIPIDDDFFVGNPEHLKLLKLYEKKFSGVMISDMEKRIVNSALAVGESMMNENIKNSIIYTCVALEILFSFDEGSIFQKSIGDRLADTFVFIVARNKDARIETAKRLKKVYAMRSALVHGGEKSINNDYIIINTLMRAAIVELLNKEKYSNIRKIDQLYEMIRDAHYSYGD